MKLLLILILLQASSLLGAIELSESKAISIFLEKNLELTASKYNIEISKAAELTAGLRKNPSVFIDSQLNSFEENWNQKNVGGPAQQDLIVTMPLDINGARKQAVKVARIATKATEANFQVVIRQSLFNMLNTLYKVRRLEQEHMLLQEKEHFFDKLTTIVERTYTTNQFLRSRTKLAHENVKLDIQQNLLFQAEEKNKLRVSLFLESRDEIKLNVSFKTLFADNLKTTELIEYALKHRPDFLAVKLLKEQMKEQMDLDQRELWDDVGLQVGISRQSQLNQRPHDIDSIELPPAWSWMVGVNVPIPVFDRNQGVILKSKIKANQLHLRQRFMEEMLLKNIETSVQKIGIINLNLKRYQKHQLENAKNVRDLASQQFETRRISLIEYLNAVDAYHNTISGYIYSQYDLTIEVLNLKLISGEEMSL